MKKWLLSTLVALLIVSCRTVMMGPSTVLCSTVEDMRGATVSRERVSGTASEHALLLSHIVLGEAAPQRAVEEAMAQGGGNCIGLSEMFLSSDVVWWIPFLYTHYTYTAEGTPLYRRERQ